MDKVYTDLEYEYSDGTTSNYPIDYIEVQRYCYTNAIAIQLYNKYDGPISTVTVNIVDTVISPKQIIVDTNNNGDGIIKWLFDNGIITDMEPDRYVQSGWCEYPVFRLTDKFYVEEVR